MKTKFTYIFLLFVILMLGGSEAAAIQITISEWVTPEPPESLANKVYVLEFWATWCGPCKTSTPKLVAIYDKYKDYGFEIVSLSVDRSSDRVRKFIRDMKVNYHVAMDYGTANRYGIRGYPTALIVNDKGQIVWTGHPMAPDFESAIIAAIQAGPPPLLAGVDLGSFKIHRKNLWGGSDFSKSFHTIESVVNDCRKPENCQAAKRIVETINTRIAEKIGHAESVRKSDPKKAYNIYAELVTKYEGIEAIKPAKTAYLELQKSN
ncbi:MAG: TlpA family protein disulfide reductase [Planctomycetes bacterium]|nr:TlpA family protein disulfide reductase [Planctomycetota bacterium]